MPNLICPIRKDAWVHELGETNGSARSPALPIGDAGPWETSVQ